MPLNRRDFVRVAGVAAAGVAAGRFPALAAKAAKVVVIGGGPGGATVAGYVKRAQPGFEVTLVEPSPIYTSCFYSNLYIGGFRTLESLTHNYDGLRGLGVDVAVDRAVDVDAQKKIVKLAGGKTLGYDRLVLSPGIDFKYDEIEGYSEAAAEIMPHAYRGAAQSKLLYSKLRAMPDGGVVVLTPPKNPYRCPPGPYERACMMAHVLKTEKPKSKLIILDPKASFSKEPVFVEAFEKYYKGIVELNLSNEFDDFTLVRVDTKTGEVVTKAGRTEKAALANIIPPQRAGEIAFRAGCTDGDWCPVRPESFLSARVEDVYVLGDSAIAADMPKSAYSANSQAKVVAADIVAALTGTEKFPARFRNTCWSMLAPDDSVKVGANYSAGERNGKPFLVPNASFVSQPGEDSALRKATFEESAAWYTTMTNDIFAKADATAGSVKAAH
jgi:sulfide dehydrogenase [flavocytochrome c] flavoprotein subunit